MGQLDLDAIQARLKEPCYSEWNRCGRKDRDAIQLLHEVERLQEKKFTLREEAEWILREGERDEEITRLREALELYADKTN